MLREMKYSDVLKTCFILALVLVLGMAGWVCQAAPKPKAAVNQEQKSEGFRQLFAAVFSRWDRNQDGKLDLKEINTVIEDPQVHGNESAVAAVLRRRLQPDEVDGTKSLTLAQVLALAGDPQLQGIVTRHARHIQTINHSLFLSSDPNLATFHQGGMGDCYLLAVIGAFVCHHAQAVRAMIRSQMGGGFEVQFGNGRQVSVKPMTDAELLMGATESSDHGIWLSVLEKSYAQVNKQAREAKAGHEIEADEAVVTDLIGHGGYYGPVIALLTGHQATGAPMGRWLKDDPGTGVQKTHELLARLTSEHRLMAAITRKDKTLPKGIPHGHVFAVLDYNASRRMVRMFNPWGNHVKPAGLPGLVNGYPTENGMFEVPIGDFPQIFAGLTYETDKPVKH
jgi:hypothetical protein